MTGTTLQIINNMIVINHDRIDDVYVDSEQQKVVLLASYLGGYNINYTNRTIILYLTLKGMYSYTVEFNRGDIQEEIVKHNFENAVLSLGARA